ncbi:metallophosphoesterase [Moraxella bovoculi]|uniref:metallophosphoesterase n=1 Tax=Moraxella bovoculi TaxID=386891 RepID=UPI003F4F3F54
MHIRHHLDTFTIAQISDLHLSAHKPIYTDKFLAVLKLALEHKPDLLLLTGDLVNDGDPHLYDWLFDELQKINIPFVCLAGNHDITHEIGHDLPFHERQFLPIQADARLVDTHRLIIELPDACWQILSINSAVHGQIYGHLDDDKLHFLRSHLANELPTIIAMHHHPLPVGSAWIDGYILQNHDDFWQALTPHPNTKAILCGHVHQAHELPIPTPYPATLYTCPATSRQFLPHYGDFKLDDVPEGLRLIHIYNKEKLATVVKRVQN